MTLTMERILGDPATVFWERNGTPVPDCHIEFVFFDHCRGEDYREFLWSRLRLTEVSLGQLSPVPFVLLGLASRSDFLSDERNIAFRQPSLGYCYLELPIALASLREALRQVERYSFDARAAFEGHIRRFGTSAGVVRLIAHGLRRADVAVLDGELRRIEPLLNDKLRTKVAGCRSRGFQKQEVAVLLDEIENSDKEEA